MSCRAGGGTAFLHRVIGQVKQLGVKPFGTWLRVATSSYNMVYLGIALVFVHDLGHGYCRRR